MHKWLTLLFTKRIEILPSSQHDGCCAKINMPAKDVNQSEGKKTLDYKKVKDKDQCCPSDVYWTQYFRQQSQYYLSMLEEKITQNSKTSMF